MVLELRRGQPLTSSSGPGENVSYAYDPVGNLTELTEAGGTTRYRYTDVNLVDQVTDPDGAITSIGYDPDNNTWRTNVNYPTGVHMVIDHDGSGRTTDIVGGATHDANGNLTASTDYAFAALGYNAGDQTTSITPRGGTAAAQTYAGASQDQRRTSGERSFVTGQWVAHEVRSG